MRIVPDSNITLYKNVDIDAGEQLVFSSREKQKAYFQSKIQTAYAPCTMVKKTGMLRVEVSGSVISQCNYLSFVNPSFDNRTIYARIIDYDYINNECTEIVYAIDYWQTWMFDVKFENMYIEREHLSESDFQKAETNPYDPTIYEFRTDESLPISKDLEKLTYNIGSDSTSDGYKIRDGIDVIADVDNTTGVVIKLANIDFSDLASVTPAIVDAWADYLWDLINIDNNGIATSGGLAFYSLTKPMGDYLAQHYPTKVKNNKLCGNGWVINGQTVNPFHSTSFNPGCCIIYDPKGADFLNNNGKLGELLNILTTEKATDQIIDLSIVPNKLMLLAAQYHDASPLLAGQLTAKADLQVENKKLMRYPYSYMRIIAPNGDIKELHYENFKNIQEGGDVCNLGVNLDVSDKPTLILSPQHYKMDGLNNANTNISEALLYNQFPTMPYTIDAFIAQVAAVANYTIANRTVDNASDMAATDTATNRTSQAIATVQGALGSAAGGIRGAENLSLDPLYNDPSIGAESGSAGVRLSGANLGVGLGIASSAASSVGMYGAGAQMAADRQKFEQAAERWNSADAALGEADGSAIANQLRLTKPAYACDKYIPSNGIGTINFNKLSFFDIILLRVKLSDEIIAVYDNWFKQYGYSSGRCGMPRVINYMKGVTDADKVPHWTIIDNKQTTYIKTMDCKIIHAMVPVAGYIKSMFDSGVRMVKGDLADDKQ